MLLDTFRASLLGNVLAIKELFELVKERLKLFRNYNAALRFD